MLKKICYKIGMFFIRLSGVHKSQKSEIVCLNSEKFGQTLVEKYAYKLVCNGEYSTKTKSVTKITSTELSNKPLYIYDSSKRQWFTMTNAKIKNIHSYKESRSLGRIRTEFPIKCIRTAYNQQDMNYVYVALKSWIPSEFHVNFQPYCKDGVNCHPVIQYLQSNKVADMFFKR